MKNEALFRDKPVWTAIFSLAIPSCITILIMTIYNMADMFFVGMLGDTAQVAAVSIVSPIFSLVMAIATMLGAGGCSVVANAIGAEKKEEAKTYSSLCCMTSVIIGIICSVVILSSTTSILNLLGANEDIMVSAYTYMRTLAVGVPFMLFSTGFASILRAEGAIKEGLIGNMMGTVLNIALDPIFILVLQKGVAGAAIATVIGNVVSSVFYLYFIVKKATVISVNPRFAMKNPMSLFHILAIGLPNGISSLLSGFASTFSNKLLVGYGTDTVAAMAAAGKAVMVITMIHMGICMGVQPLMAYTYGAKNGKRMKEILKKLLLLTVVFGTMITIICFMTKHELIGLFLKNTSAASMGESLVIYLLLASPFMGIFYLSTNFLQACGKALPATIISVLRQGGILIPCLYLMEHFMGFTGIAVAYTIADLFSVIIASISIILVIKSEKYLRE